MTLSDRYIADRKQPDKSIDLVDEACSRLRLEQESKPEIIWQVERDLLTKQIEMTALENEEDKKSKSRKEEVKKEVHDLREKLSGLNEMWRAERDELDRTKIIQKELDEAKKNCEKARMAGDFATAGKLKHGTIPELESKLRSIENAMENNDKPHKMLSEFVSKDAIATCIARHTGIPVSKITGNESKKLLDMESILRQVSYI